jgi:hypothetical protein
LNDILEKPEYQAEGKMDNFQLAGKAKTVFKLIELMAKGEQAKAAGSKK